MCMLSKSYLRTSVAMAVAIPNCIGVEASVQAAVISCSTKITIGCSVAGHTCQSTT